MVKEAKTSTATTTATNGGGTKAQKRESIQRTKAHACLVVSRCNAQKANRSLAHSVKQNKHSATPDHMMS